ncbi:ATP-binding protein [Iningainema tapete]|uniref:histidine kinase n=1 Tax=Iningainema tapete BLCC-T55 TaxID=2748662 RepID=A0A8J7BYJ1_9CYAN|nr:ATP-binding protein [Iningainema tapete]MBD2775832.1 response regulator [Iningainema tapete BLCC-T55]
MYVLIIDDNLDARLLIARELEREFPGVELEQIIDAASFDQALAAGRFDLTVTDYQLFWTNGLEILRSLKTRYPERPVIMFTNTGTQEIAVEAMKEGLEDYIIKSPKYYPRLRTAVRLALERAQERQQAALTQLRLESLLNQLNVGVFRAIPDGQLIEGNPAFLRLLGVESLAGVDARQFNGQFSRTGGLVPGQPRERQIQFRNTLGEDLWLSISQTLNTINGQTVIEGVVEDMTGLKRSEAFLKRYAQRLENLQELDRSILRATSISEIAQAAVNSEYELIQCQLLDVTLFDLERQQATVLAVRSNGNNKRYGFSVGETFPLQDFSNIETLQQNQAVVIENLAEYSRSTAVLQRLFDQGIRAWTNAPIHAEGRLFGIINVGTTQPGTLSNEDMVIVHELANQLAIAIEQARLREELHRYTTELEQIISERTQQLQEANEDLETYAYSISHDLREPLRAMQGFAQILMDGYAENLNSVAQHYLNRILKAAERMDTLLGDLLVYNRLNRLNLPVRSLNLSLAVADALAQLELKIQEHQVLLTIEEPLLFATGHYQSVVQIIANLISNAIKFVPPGTQPQIRIWTQQREGWVRLWVEDNGIGIAPQYHKRIFNPFERLHGEETYPGTGIGLAIVRRAIERMGGQVGVESGVGRGSRFWFELIAGNNS